MYTNNPATNLSRTNHPEHTPKKIIRWLALAGVFTVVLSACGGGGGGGGGNDNDDNNNPPSSEWGSMKWDEGSWK